jgi:hypothetical protein
MTTRFIILLMSLLWLAEQSVAQALDVQPADHRDGAHDFDFDLGLWKTHSTRRTHPLSGSSDWVDTDGTTDVKPIWDGRANIAEFSSDSPGGRVEFMAIRVYNPTTRQWSLNFATPNVGMLSATPGIGEFVKGRSDFYNIEPFNGKSILSRFSIWSTSASTAQSEQAFSEDGGKTWEVNLINKYTRITPQNNASK